MKIHKVSQTGLTLKIECEDSVLSRFLSSKTDRLNNKNIIRIAKICVKQATMRELYNSLRKISKREQVYLLYCYGFTDNTEHTLIGTAIHFNLRESRTKKLEEDALDNLWLELP